MSHSLNSGRCVCECNRYVCALEFLKRSRSVCSIKPHSRCVHLLKAHFSCELTHHVILFPTTRNVGNDVRSESDMSLISFSVTVFFFFFCVCVSTFRHLRQFNPSGNVTAALVKGVDLGFNKSVGTRVRCERGDGPFTTRCSSSLLVLLVGEVLSIQTLPLTSSRPVPVLFTCLGSSVYTWHFTATKWCYVSRAPTCTHSKWPFS